MVNKSLKYLFFFTLDTFSMALDFTIGEKHI